MIGPNVVPLTTVTSCNTHNNNNNFHHYHSNNNRINNIDTIQKNNNHAVLPIHQNQPEQQQQQQGQSYQHNNRQPKNKRKLNKGISSTSTMTGTKSNKKSRLFNIIHNYSNENFDETLNLLNNDKQNIFNNENIIIFENGSLSNKEEIDYNTCLDLQTPQIQLENNQQSQLSSDPEIKEIENSNLSWLLNFKVASLFDSTSSEDGNSSRRSSSEDDVKEEREDIMTVTSPDRPHKPPYTYTELIEQALKEKGELTVSGIYYWISERFPFYKVHDDRWKNSVRHNLSINPHFRKGMKASQGAGHLWTLSTQGVSPSPEVWKKNRVKNLINLMDEVAVATASIEEPSDPTTLEALSPQPSLPLTETSPDPSLARSAEEILSGVKKQVEVQYLTPDPDFLNHITKDEVIEEEESSLVTEVTNPPYLISDLGSEVILTDGLFCDDLNFQCCELTTTTNLT